MWKIIAASVVIMFIIKSIIAFIKQKNNLVIKDLNILIIGDESVTFVLRAVYKFKLKLELSGLIMGNLSPNITSNDIYNSIRDVPESEIVELIKALFDEIEYRRQMFSSLETCLGSISFEHFHESSDASIHGTFSNALNAETMRV